MWSDDQNNLNDRNFPTNVWNSEHNISKIFPIYTLSSLQKLMKLRKLQNEGDHPHSSPVLPPETWLQRILSPTSSGTQVGNPHSREVQPGAERRTCINRLHMFLSYHTSVMIILKNTVLPHYFTLN